MKKLHIPNHKLYEQYYLDQAKQKGGNLPAFHGTRFQRGYGLGSIFKGLFRWAVPHLQQKKLHIPNHKLYEQYYLDQAKQKGGNLPAFHGTRFQRGYGLGSIFKGLFRWAVPHLQQGAKMLGKKALQEGVNVAQDVLAGENFSTAVAKHGK